ncbi:hypothetical protein [Deinococcus soli (ex Cha et al. 2016)]|uniref:hypothetical protein n=1 Tax=Deinococcus soli (ex Cha et al. 2016) TaxID=1309411 RepID=UPI00166C5275|nr:hypothetical protein [Deinococcus soli (ex Cha et al. 2016)]GGB70860.1 hypothetical protein GCM10008019_28790 [Deinococcus soli (ex Cha et al. 2016)]
MIDATRSVLNAALALPEQERHHLLRILQDVPEIRGSMQYITLAPTPLSPVALRAHLTVHYAERWQLPLTDVPTLLDTIAASGAPEPAPLAPPADPGVAGHTVRRLQQLLEAGWTPPRLAQAINEAGMNVGRGAIRQLSRGRHLDKATPELLTALEHVPDHPPAEGAPKNVKGTYQEAMRSLGWTSVTDLNDFLCQLSHEQRQPVQVLINTLGERALSDALHGDGPGPRSAAFDNLTTYLVHLAHAQQLHAELQRAGQMGWTPATLTAHLRVRGYNGPAVQADLHELHSADIEPLVTLLREHVQAGPPTPGASILIHPGDRTSYVHQVLDAKGIISSADLCQPFGMTVSEAMTFLRKTMKLRPCGHGQFRRHR